MPFDRLVEAMDAWAGRNPSEQVFAQIGNSVCNPNYMTWAKLISPDLFREKCKVADLMISHAGIGNILLAIELQKPIIVMPRRPELNEHRNDHQMATVRRLKEKAGIGVVYDAAEPDKAIQWVGTSNIRPAPHTEASSELLTTVRDFIRALP